MREKPQRGNPRGGVYAILSAVRRGRAGCPSTQPYAKIYSRQAVSCDGAGPYHFAMVRLRRLLPLCALVLLMAGCSGPSEVVRSPTPPAPTAPTPGLPLAAVVALEQLGTPYRYGGAAPGGFDCSGLVWYSYLQSGTALPRATIDQYRYVQPVAQQAAQPGDLLFFKLAGKISHVGIYLGEERFVHAPSSGRRVEIVSLSDPYWRSRLVRIGRIP